MNRITGATNWRINFIHQQYLKFRWELRRLLDFSKKEKVNNISVIVVGRNDNYGGDFSLRLKTTLDWNLSHLPNSELIYVEWNQLKDKPSDCEWIVKKYPNAKCYIVPNEIHRKIAATPEKMPVMEYFAKNLGIRKANNDWILLINADVYIEPSDFKNLKLSSGYVYGTAFCNVDWNGFPIHSTAYNKSVKFTGYPYGDLAAVVGNFILTHRNNWMKIKGYDESLNDVRYGVDNDALFQFYYFGIKPMLIGHHFHLDHSESASKGNNESHGAVSKLRNRKYPYINSDNWGLSDYPSKQVSDNIFELQDLHSLKCRI